MNPIFQMAQKLKLQNSANFAMGETDPKGKVLSLLQQMTPNEKNALKQQLPMIQNIARKLGISDNNINQCLSELQGKF